MNGGDRVVKRLVQISSKINLRVQITLELVV